MKTVRYALPVLALVLALLVVAPASEAQSGNVWNFEFFNNTSSSARPYLPVKRASSTSTGVLPRLRRRWRWISSAAGL